MSYSCRYSDNVARWRSVGGAVKHMAERGAQTRILFLGSNPAQLSPLALTAEFNHLSREFYNGRDEITLLSRWGISAAELPSLIMDFDPHVLHFSGHGAETGELVFAREHGGTETADQGVIARVFELVAGSVRCVVLNACYSAEQAKLIAKHVDIVIGMSRELSDSDAFSFTKGFYEALGRGKTIKEAFALAVLQMRLAGATGDDIPVLHAREGLKLDNVRLHGEERKNGESNANPEAGEARDPGPPHYPPQHEEASTISQHNKLLVAVLTVLRLLILVIIAVLAMLAVNNDGLRQVSLVGSTIAFAVLAIVEVAVWFSRPDKRWYDARSLTESIKTLTWYYVTRHHAFASPTVDDREAGRSMTLDELFAKRLKHAIGEFADLTLVPRGDPGSPVTAWMKQTRASNFATRRRAYLEYRLMDQILWYSDKMRLNNTRGRRWSLALIGIYLTGVTCAILEIIATIPIDILGVIGTTAISILAWIQSARHSGLAHEYSVTCNNLRLLLPRFDNVDEVGWSALVDEVEGELAREHSVWQSQRRVPRPE